MQQLSNFVGHYHSEKLKYELARHGLQDLFKKLLKGGVDYDNVWTLTVHECMDCGLNLDERRRYQKVLKEIAEQESGIRIT